jgi:hypothetical protein
LKVELRRAGLLQLVWVNVVRLPQIPQRRVGKKIEEWNISSNHVHGMKSMSDIHFFKG